MSSRAWHSAELDRPRDFQTVLGHSAVAGYELVHWNPSRGCWCDRDGFPISVRYWTELEAAPP